ncbi:MAG: sigma-70 family RNA polymerase sigma factor [Desulfosoma sp.]|uniref:sigma-70 family RNA polymerase sigma factor n=1 Tax=Desulfosoma sp. TaxID=2603217 RepID=UPI00404ACE4D
MKSLHGERLDPLYRLWLSREAEDDDERLLDMGILGSEEDLFPEPLEEEESVEDKRNGLLHDEQRDLRHERFPFAPSVAAEETELEGDAAVEFDEDHVTCYLREVSSFPLLTPEMEIELAKRIRDGQDRLVQLVESHKEDHPVVKDLHGKVRNLLGQAKTFPGVRDKVLKVISRTLHQAVAYEPQNPILLSMKETCDRTIAEIDEAKHAMVKANLRLVLSIAKRYRGRGMSFDDLIQEGNLGLLKAVGRYDHTKGNRFSTYATWWVRQSIIRGIYDKTRTIRLPVHFIELKNLFFKVFHELVKELGREPTAEEISHRANIPPDKVEMVLSLISQPLSLEMPVGDDEQRLSDFIEDVACASPAQGCETNELSEVTREILASLQPREEKILRLRFGLGGRPGETLEKIGKSFKVSKERIRQIEKKALRKLRHPSKQELLKPYLD